MKIDKSLLPGFTDETKNIFGWGTDPCKCDMWIDRVRIENAPAHRYLTLREEVLFSKVNSEVYWSMRNYNSSDPVPNYFYFEECQMSHFHCIKELNRHIMQSSGNRNSMVVWLNYDLFKAHIPDCWNLHLNSQQLKNYLYDKFGLNKIVMGSYALEGFSTGDSVNQYRRSKHPNTLSQSDYNQNTRILSYINTPLHQEYTFTEYMQSEKRSSLQQKRCC